MTHLWQDNLICPPAFKSPLASQKVLCIHRHLQSCVGTRARLGYAAFNAQLRKHIVTTRTIRYTYVWHDISTLMLVWGHAACLHVRSLWYEHACFEITWAMLWYARACRRLCIYTIVQVINRHCGLVDKAYLDQQLKVAGSNPRVFLFLPSIFQMCLNFCMIQTHFLSIEKKFNHVKVLYTKLLYLNWF